MIRFRHGKCESKCLYRHCFRFVKDRGYVGKGKVKGMRERVKPNDHPVVDQKRTNRYPKASRASCRDIHHIAQGMVMSCHFKERQK